MKLTFFMEICPICKDDLVVLPKDIAQQCGNIDRLVLVSKIASQIHLTSPLTGQRYTFNYSMHLRI